MHGICYGVPVGALPKLTIFEILTQKLRITHVGIIKAVKEPLKLAPCETNFKYFSLLLWGLFKMATFAKSPIPTPTNFRDFVFRCNNLIWQILSLDESCICEGPEWT